MKVHATPLSLLRVLCLVLPAASLLVGTSSAGESVGPDPEMLRLVVRSPLEQAGDVDALAAALLDAMAARPGDLSCELLARRLGSLRTSLRDQAALVPPIERLLGASPGVEGIPRQVLTDILADLYRLQGRHEDSRRLRQGRGFVDQWLVIGPFGKGRASLMLRPFPPEKEQIIDAKYTDGWQQLSWRRITRERPESLFSPLLYTYPRTGIAYALAQVKSDEEREVLLHRGSTDSLRVWLNGKLVIDDDLRAEHLDSRRKTGIRLARGWNRLLVKTRSPYWLRLSDPRDNPLAPEAVTEEEGLLIHPVESPPEPAWDGPFLPTVTSRWHSWVESLDSGGDSDAEAGEEVSGATKLRADAHLGLAMLYDFYGRDALAVAQVEKALALVPGDPAILFRAGHVYRGAAYLPSNLAKNRAKGAFESVLSAEPEFVPAYERVARFLAEDQQHTEAIKKLRQGMEQSDSYLPALLRLKAIYSEQGWQNEEIAVVRDIEKLSPSSPVPSGFWGGYYRSSQNAQEASTRMRAAYNLDRRQTHLLQDMASLALGAGDAKTCEELLRELVSLVPDSAAETDRLGNFLTDQGRFDEALELAKKMAEKYPLDPSRVQRIAEILDLAGKRDEALATYERALRLEPGNITLARYIQDRKESEVATAGDDAFWVPYDERLEDWFGQIPLEGPFVAQAASLLVLDIAVLRLKPDGSYSEYTHQVHKLLSEESKEDLANVVVGEEILKLRTVTADGESLEPVAAEGKRSYVMPGLSAGAYIEVAYRNDRARAGGRPFRGTGFYFQDMRFSSPFVLSRYVVILPEGMDLSFLERGLPAEGTAGEGEAESGGVPFARVEKKVTKLDSGETVIIYEARNAPRIEPEPLMPLAEEYIPNVQMLEDQPWEEVAAQLRQRYAGGSRLTPELEAAAAEATRDVTDPLARVRAVYDYVNQLVTNDAGSGNAVQVLLEKAGDRNVLFKALLDALDVPVSWVYLRPNENYLARTDWSVPRWDLFPYGHLMVELEGQEPLFISLAQRMTPFARLPEHFDGGKALVVGADDQRVLRLPTGDPEDSATVSTVSLQLTDETAVDVNMELVSKALMAFAQKDRLKTLSAFQKDLALRAMANQLFPGASLKSGDLRDLGDPDKPFAVLLDLKAPKFLRQRGEEYLLRVVLQPAQMVRRYCTAPRRKHPFHFRGQMVMRDSVEVRPGEAYEIAATPADVLLVSPLGTYSLTFRKDGDVLRVRRELSLFAGRIAPSEFAGFVEFSRKIDAAEQESVVCRKRS